MDELPCKWNKTKWKELEVVIGSTTYRLWKTQTIKINKARFPNSRACLKFSKNKTQGATYFCINLRLLFSLRLLWYDKALQLPYLFTLFVSCKGESIWKLQFPVSLFGGTACSLMSSCYLLTFNSLTHFLSIDDLRS